MLLDEFGKKEYERMTKSFEMLGDIAIIDAERKTARKFAEIVMKAHKNIETVLRKGGAVAGKYRTRKYIFVLGKKNFIANYIENGASFVFDVRKVFFSPRLGYERKRIMDLSKDGENVIVMFAGVGPFAVEIAKKNRRSMVIAIEMNKTAYKYLLENIKKNKLLNVVPELGDANSASVKYKGFADRIIMPLPKSSHKFLDSALSMAAKNCVIHYYAFVDDEGEAERKRLKEFALKNGRKIRVVGQRTVRPYSSRISEIVLDAKVI